jgi:DNA-directed RNA polymerase specialized sigma24 family protein
MNSFVGAAEAGRLKALTNSDELWRILITMMARKSHAFQQKQSAEKRGDGLVRGDLVFHLVAEGRVNGNTIGDPHRFVDELLSECRERIDALPDEILRTIAVKRMEGYEVTEIAAEVSLSVATIKRKLARIRDLWTADAPLEKS